MIIIFFLWNVFLILWYYQLRPLYFVSSKVAQNLKIWNMILCCFFFEVGTILKFKRTKNLDKNASTIHSLSDSWDWYPNSNFIQKKSFHFNCILFLYFLFTSLFSFIVLHTLSNFSLRFYPHHTLSVTLCLLLLFSICHPFLSYIISYSSTLHSYLFLSYPFSLYLYFLILTYISPLS